MKENKINHHVENVIKDSISIRNGDGGSGHRDKDKCDNNNNGKIGGTMKDNGHNNVILFMADAKDFLLSGCGGLMKKEEEK